jgi:hypothetical protein
VITHEMYGPLGGIRNTVIGWGIMVQGGSYRVEFWDKVVALFN